MNSEVERPPTLIQRPSQDISFAAGVVNRESEAEEAPDAPHELLGEQAILEVRAEPGLEGL